MSDTIDINNEILGPGGRLRLGREALRLPVEALAERLRLRVQQIIDIENDNYQEETRFVFVRGYLRNYAKIVGVSSEDIMQAFAQLGLQEIPSDRPCSALNKIPAPARTMPLRWITYSIATGLVILVALWWQAQRSSHDLPAMLTVPAELVSASSDADPINADTIPLVQTS